MTTKTQLFIDDTIMHNGQVFIMKGFILQSGVVLIEAVNQKTLEVKFIKTNDTTKWV